MEKLQRIIASNTLFPSYPKIQACTYTFRSFRFLGVRSPQRWGAHLRVHLQVHVDSTPQSCTTKEANHQAGASGSPHCRATPTQSHSFFFVGVGGGKSWYATNSSWRSLCPGAGEEGKGSEEKWSEVKWSGVFKKLKWDRDLVFWLRVLGNPGWRSTLRKAGFSVLS